MIYLNKILPFFVLPLGVTLMLLIAGLALRRRALIATALAILWLGSTPVVAAFLIRAAEGWSERAEARSAATADAIVVLSGGRITAPGQGKVSEWADADRFFAGVELFHAGKAPILVFTGGAVPWDAGAPPEGDVLRRYAEAMGVPSERILVTGVVSNTAGEATAAWSLLRGRQASPPAVLLVTSAFHMPRATRLFEQAGFAVRVFPVDFFGYQDTGLNVLDFFPSPAALGHTQLAMREAYGRLFYRIAALW